MKLFIKSFDTALADAKKQMPLPLQRHLRKNKIQATNFDANFHAWILFYADFAKSILRNLLFLHLLRRIKAFFSKNELGALLPLALLLVVAIWSR